MTTTYMKSCEHKDITYLHLEVVEWMLINVFHLVH